MLSPLVFAASPSANKDPTLKLSDKYGPVVVEGEGIPLGGLISPDWKLAVRLEGQVGSLKEKEPGSGSPIWQSRALRDGDKVITGSNSYAKIIMADGSSVVIGPNSIVIMNMYQLTQQPLSVHIKLIAGKLLVDMKTFFGKESNFEITTPNGIISSRGTKYEVGVQENETTVTVYEGTVDFTSSFDQKESLIETGQIGVLSSTDLQIIFPEEVVVPLQIFVSEPCANEYSYSQTYIDPYTEKLYEGINTSYNLCLYMESRPTFTFFTNQFLNPETINKDNFRIYDENNQLLEGYLDVGSTITFIPSKPLHGKIKAILKGGEEGICAFSGTCLLEDAIFEFKGADELESPEIPFELTGTIPIFIQRNIIIKNDGANTAKEITLSVPSFKSYPPSSFVKLFEINTDVPYTLEQGENDFIKLDIQELLPGESIEVNVSYTSILFGIDYFSRIDATKISESVDKELLNKFTMPEEGMEVDSPEIQELSKAIVGEETNPFWKAYRIYSWITDTIAYDYGKERAVKEGERPSTGALLTLQTKTGICDDYAKLFIALARAAGIPSRYVILYVQREKLEAHASAEIYLPPYGWIPLDPTWGVESPSFAIREPLLPIICKEATVPDCNYEYILEGINAEGVKVSLPMEISDIELKNSDDWLFFFKEPFFEDIYELVSITGINKDLEFLRAYNTELDYRVLNISTSPKTDSVFLISKAIKSQQENNYLSVQPEIKEGLIKSIMSATEEWSSLLEQFRNYLQQKYSTNLEDQNFVIYSTTTIGYTGEAQVKNVLLKDVLSDIDLATNKSNAAKDYINNNDSSTASKQLEESYYLLFGIDGSVQWLISDIIGDYMMKAGTTVVVQKLVTVAGIVGIILLFIILVIAPLFWIWMWADCLKRKGKFNNLNKIGWFFIVFFGYPIFPFGAVVYFFTEYRKRDKK